MMNNKENSKIIGKKVLERIEQASKILILPDASRVDYDCLGTAIALKKFIQKKDSKEVKVYLFGKIPDYLANFNNIASEIETKYVKEVDFDYYDLIFIVDTNDWDRALTRECSKILGSVDKNKFINIDHHIAGTISQDIPDNLINFHDVCAGKVLFDTLIEPSNVPLDSDIANSLYISLAGDSSIFKFIQDDTFEYAQKLISAGANHNKITDFILNFSKGSIDYFLLAVEHTKYYPELKLSVLTIDENLFDLFTTNLGDEWRKDDYAEFYKEYFQRRVDDYLYGITFRYDPETQGTRISFRTRGSDGTLELLPILEGLGFRVGGHRNAAGGFTGLKPKEAEAKFVDAMRDLSSNSL